MGKGMLLKDVIYTWRRLENKLIEICVKNNNEDSCLNNTWNNDNASSLDRKIETLNV